MKNDELIEMLDDDKVVISKKEYEELMRYKAAYIGQKKEDKV